MSDLAGKLATARERLPLRTLMTQRSKGPSNGHWKTFPKCPYCGKDSAGVRDHAGRAWFKCYHTSCPSGTAGAKQSWDEIGFLAYELGLSRREAFLTFLKEAGVWEAGREERRLPELPEGEEPPQEEPPPDRFEDLPPMAREPDEGSTALPSIVEMPIMGTSKRATFPTMDGRAAVPDPPPVADGVTASPAASAGVPTPPPGEAALSPAAAGTPGATDAGPLAQVAAPPGDAVVQTPADKVLQPVAMGEQRLGAPESDEPEADAGRVTPAVKAIRYFYERLVLLPADLLALRTRRGLSRRQVLELGYRSSPRSNEALLRAMAEQFPVNVLLAAGLWTRGDRLSDVPRPNVQYCGWGVSGKKPGPRGDEESWGWRYAILIPYLNRAGEVLDLRVHKRTQRGQVPRLYVPRRLAGVPGLPPSRAEAAFGVVTEGEFKGGALRQALAARAIVSALPGITMSKPLWGDLVDWLLDELPPGRPVVVVYDNEDKGTEGLPGYQASRLKRHDSALWARYLAKRLLREGFAARVGLLPDAWRDARGKVDWDSALSLRERASK